MPIFFNEATQKKYSVHVEAAESVLIPVLRKERGLSSRPNAQRCVLYLEFALVSVWDVS